jgi:hypothetical protein
MPLTRFRLRHSDVYGGVMQSDGLAQADKLSMGGIQVNI